MYYNDVNDALHVASRADTSRTGASACKYRVARNAPHRWSARKIRQKRTPGPNEISQ
jgi:hypothetical protein